MVYTAKYVVFMFLWAQVGLPVYFTSMESPVKTVLLLTVLSLQILLVEGQLWVASFNIQKLSVKKLDIPWVKDVIVQVCIHIRLDVLHTYISINQLPVPLDLTPLQTTSLLKQCERRIYDTAA